MLLNSEIPVMIKLANGEVIMARVLRARVVKDESPLGRPCIHLIDVGTFQAGRHPQKQNEIMYSLLQWQAPEVYIPLDKVMSLGVASDVGQDYYRQVFQRVQVADINEVAAVERGAPQVFQIP